MKALKFFSLFMLVLVASSINTEVAAHAFEASPPSGPQRMRRYEVALAEHVIALVRRSSWSSYDPLLREAKKLLGPAQQMRLRQDLREKLGDGDQFEKTERFEDLLREVDATLTPNKLEELRQETKRGRPRTHAWPWPLCVITGCRR